MKTMGQDAALLPVTCDDDGTVSVEGEPIGHLQGFTFTVDHRANHEDRRLLLAAGEKALPRLLAERAERLLGSDLEGVTLERGAILWDGRRLAKLEPAADPLHPRIVPERELTQVPERQRQMFLARLGEWLATHLHPLAPLAALQTAARDPAAGSQARALLLTLVAGHGYVSREEAGLEHLPKDLRPALRRLGVTFGALDVFARDLLKPAPRRLLHALGQDRRTLSPDMIPVVAGAGNLPSGYRPAGTQFVRIDLAEKLLKTAHEARATAAAKAKNPMRARFVVDPALAISTGLELASFHRLLGAAGFRRLPARALAEGTFGPPAPDRWEWRPARKDPKARRQEPSQNAPSGNAFAALADLVR